MTDKKTITITSLITMSIILASIIVPGFFDTQKYYCESESSIMECAGDLSGGMATRCYLNIEDTSWDYCSSGWVEINDDRLIQEEPINKTIISKVNTGKQYSCSPNECVEIINDY